MSQSRLELPAALRIPRVAAMLLVLAVVATYLPGILGGTFHFDDLHHVSENPAVTDAGNLLKYFADVSLWSNEPKNHMYRPVGMFVHGIDFQVWRLVAGNGYYGPGWLLTNALLHATAAILVWRLALRLGLASVPAFLAGAIMAVHPVHSEVVNYVSARSESITAVLMLCALLVHFRAREAVGRRRVLLVTCALLLSMSSLLSKETAALFFAAVAWYELVATPGTWRERARRALCYGGVYMLGLVAILFLRQQMLEHAVASVRIVTPKANADVQMGHGRTLVENLMTQSKVVVLYYDLILRPVGLTVDHDVSIVRRLTPGVVAAVVLHAAIVAAAIRSAVRGRRLFPLCVGWFWLFLMPSVTVPLNVVMNEHRLYLPGIAFALLGGSALAFVAGRLHAYGRPRLAGLAVALPFVLFVAIGAHRSVEWRTDERLWVSALERAPQSARAHMHLGIVRHIEAAQLDGNEALVKLDRALELYEAADALHPGWYNLYLNIGRAWLDRGRNGGGMADFEKALAAYERLEAIKPKKPVRARMFQSLVLTELERYDEALALLHALDEADDSLTTEYDDKIARIYRKQGRNEEAYAAMLRVVEIEEPRDRTVGLTTLGWWAYEDGDLKAAEGYLSRALKIGQARGMYMPNLHVARFMHLVGEPAGAQEFIRGAIEAGWEPTEEQAAWVMGAATTSASGDL